MHGDFSRMTFDPNNHYSRVLLQQGRVLLDADWNELSDIVLHYLRTLAKATLGPHAAVDQNSFKITTANATDFQISYGGYYVDGILAENNNREPSGTTPVTYINQPNYPTASQSVLPTEPYLVYLDVWERHLTHIEATDPYTPGIREIALNGSDTATRTKIVWQVKVAHFTNGEKATSQTSWRSLMNTDWLTRTYQWQSLHRGSLKVRTTPGTEGKATNACLTAPDSNYRGTENQLYRVEIHTAGGAGTATFKWSRDNGTMIFPVSTLSESSATVENLGRDSRSTLVPNDWVELVDDDRTLSGHSGILIQVKDVNVEQATVLFKAHPGRDFPMHDAGKLASKHMFLRRWDYTVTGATPTSALSDNATQSATDGALTVEEDKWLVLENGVEICFHSNESEPHKYRTGDYWLIPARVITGAVEWPGSATEPKACSPYGVTHSYAPLAVITPGTTPIIDDCRWVIQPAVAAPKIQG